MSKQALDKYKNCADKLSYLSELIMGLNEKELQQLNHMCVERLNLLTKARSIRSLADFNVGDHVYFDYRGEMISGEIKKLNHKTASILTKDKRRWNVSPQFLKKYIDV